MPSYTHKGISDLAYDANKKFLRTAAVQIYDALINEALAEMTRQFNEALARGEVLRLRPEPEEMLGFLRAAVEQVKQLELPSAEDR